jgi:hypothetical protein
MEVHRNWRQYVSGPAVIVLAVLCFCSPRLLAATGREFVLGDWVGYALGIAALAGAVSLMRDAHNAFGLRINEQGVSAVNGTSKVELDWPDIIRISIDQRPIDGRRGRPRLLTVWTLDTVTAQAQPDLVLPGLHGYRIADVAAVREPVREIEEALQRYGGDRYLARTG